MIKHKDLLTILRSNKMRITPARRILLQYILDSATKQLSLKEIQAFLEKKLPGVDRSSIYRNLETFKKLDLSIVFYGYCSKCATASLSPNVA